MIRGELLITHKVFQHNTPILPQEDVLWFFVSVDDSGSFRKQRVLSICSILLITFFIQFSSVRKLPQVSFVHLLDSDAEIVYVFKGIEVLHNVGVRKPFHDVHPLFIPS